MQAQVKEWGNSQGIRLPKEVLKSAGIALNDVLDVTVSNGVITLVKPFRHKTLEERVAGFDGKLMLDGEKADRLPISEMINVSDAIQGIFEYI